MKVVARVASIFDSNTRTMAVGVEIFYEGESVPWKRFKRNAGVGTPLKAAYLAVFHALMVIVPRRSLEIVIFTNSKRLIKQILGYAEPRTENLASLYKSIQGRSRMFVGDGGKVDLKWAPKEDNFGAYVLAREALNEYPTG